MTTVSITLSKEDEVFLLSIIKSQENVKTLEEALLFILHFYMKIKSGALDNAETDSIASYSISDSSSDRILEALKNALPVKTNPTPMLENIEAILITGTTDGANNFIIKFPKDIRRYDKTGINLRKR